MTVTHDLSILSLISQASVLVQLVMALLATLSLMSWYWIFHKWFQLRAARTQTDIFERDFWSGGDLNTLYEAANRHETGGMERIFESGYREYTKLRAKNHDHSAILDGSRRAMRATFQRVLTAALAPLPPLDWAGLPAPAVVLLAGINGSGKTTTAAKLAHLARRAGRTPLLGAADTFRAAGSHQLQLWAERLGCEAVIGATGGDAAAVAYDAIDAAIARKCDLVLVDTAGRMHTREPLMRELQKVRTAMGKRLPGAPHHTWLVLDAMLGQNAVVQARQFHEMTPLSGVIVTKLDGSSKAGFLFAVRQELNLPVLFAGLGEGLDDLVPFDAPTFVNALLDLDGPA